MNNGSPLTLLRSLALASTCSFTAVACSNGGGSTLPQQASNVSTQSLAGGGSTLPQQVSNVSTQSLNTHAILSAAPASGGALFSDTFAQDAIGAQASGWKVLSGSWSVCQPTGATHQYCANGSAAGITVPTASESSWTNYEVDTGTLHGSKGGGAAILFRMTDAQHFYQFEARSDVSNPANQSWDVSRYDGSWHKLMGSALSAPVGQSIAIRIVVAGSAITAFNGAALLGTTTDETYKSGGIGLRTFATTSSAFSNISVTTTTSSTPSPSPTSGPTSAPSGVAMYDGCPIFTAGDYYNADITNAKLDPHSANYIAAVTAKDSANFYASTGIEQVNEATSSTALYAVKPKVSWHTFPWKQPWQTGYYVEPIGDDHSIVLLATPPACHVYELYSTSFSGGVLSAYSGVTYDLSKPFVVQPNGYNSAMASGLSLFAGMVKYEEIASGIHHALNISAIGGSLCNCYTAPASSTDGVAYKGPASYPLPYGAHLRLKATFDDSSFGPQSKAVAEAMKHYGVFLADTGCCNSAVYMANPTHGGSWNGSDLSSIGKIRLSNFDVLPVGKTVAR